MVVVVLQQDHAQSYKTDIIWSLYAYPQETSTQDHPTCLKHYHKKRNDTESSVQLKTIFARHGIVEKLVCDNASYYTSEAFHSFAQEWNFRVVHSSPRFPQSNGLSEKTVCIVNAYLRRLEIAKRIFILLY